MGTALTEEQFGELRKDASRVVLAFDADRSGQEAMLRAARTGGHDALHVVEMPEGKDPADLIAAGEADAFRERLDHPVPMMRFQVLRVLADADLETPAGRDLALERAARLIAEHTTEGSAIREALVREVADPLDLPIHRVHAEIAAQSGVRRVPVPSVPPQDPGPAFPAGASAGAVAFGAERDFLARCLASGDLGRRYLSLPADDQLSTDATRRAREHLVSHFEDPLAELPEDEPALGRLVSEVVHAAGMQRPSEETVLRMSIHQLEKRRLEREIRHAEDVGDHARKSELAAALQRVRREFDTGIGQTA
jgi:DNA primase